MALPRKLEGVEIEMPVGRLAALIGGFELFWRLGVGNNGWALAFFSVGWGFDYDVFD